MLTDDAAGDPLAGHIRERKVHQLGWIGLSLADEVVVQPLLRDPFELPEEVQLGVLTGITPFRVEQPLGEVEEEG